MTQNVLAVRMIIIEIIATAVFVIVDVHQSLDATHTCTGHKTQNPYSFF